MSDSDVPYDVGWLSNITDGDVEALRTGQVPSDHPQLGEIVAFIRDLQMAYPEAATEDLERSHLAKMMEAARLVADEGAAETSSGSEARASGEDALSLPRSRSRAVRALLASRGARVAGGMLAVFLGFAGIAVAGALPPTVQNAVADAARTVGVDLPGGTAEMASPGAEADPELGVDPLPGTASDGGNSGQGDVAAPGQDGKGRGSDADRAKSPTDERQPSGADPKDGPEGDARKRGESGDPVYAPVDPGTPTNPEPADPGPPADPEPADPAPIEVPPAPPQDDQNSDVIDDIQDNLRDVLDELDGDLGLGR